MADPIDDSDTAAAPPGARPSTPPPHDEADARAAEQGMAKSVQAAQAFVDAAEATAAAFAEKDAAQQQASAPHVGAGGDGSAVNSQAAESAALANAFSGEGAPVIGEAGLAQVAAQATGLALLNAVNAQQNAYVTANAAVAAIVSRILALAPSANGDRADG
jgi:hypothetical protein